MFVPVMLPRLIVRLASQHLHRSPLRQGVDRPTLESDRDSAEGGIEDDEDIDVIAMSTKLAEKQEQLLRLEAQLEHLDALVESSPHAGGVNDLETAGLEIELRSAQAQARALEEQAARLEAQKRHLESLMAELDRATSDVDVRRRPTCTGPLHSSS